MVDDHVRWRRIVCLANSRKGGDRCLAGKEIMNHKVAGWIRPVGSGRENAVTTAERTCDDRSEVDPLDVVDVPLSGRAFHEFQVEDYRLARGELLRKRGRLGWDRLHLLTDDPEAIWPSEHFQNLGRAKNDRVHRGEAARFGHSLLFVRVQDLEVEITEWEGRQSVRGRFEYRSGTYDLKITDPVMAAHAQRTGDLWLSAPYLCLSLGEPFQQDDMCYKLIATVIDKERAESGAWS